MSTNVSYDRVFSLKTERELPCYQYSDLLRIALPSGLISHAFAAHSSAGVGLKLEQKQQARGKKSPDTHKTRHLATSMNPPKCNAVSRLELSKDEGKS
jgi:hypothetical protein